MDQDTYSRLIGLLDEHRARYRVIEHPAEGRTEIVSRMRGNDVSHAAKCIILIVKLGKRTTKYVLAVIPGNLRVDLAAVKQLLSATYVSFASPQVAERLAGSVAETILPFAFSSELELIADPMIREADELYFNAARLDRSVALRTCDYLGIARPRMAHITEATGKTTC